MPEQQEFAQVSLPMNVQDAMRDNLPQMVNKLLREELEKGERAIKTVEILNNRIAKLEELEQKHQSLRAREAKLEKAEAEAEKVKEMLREKVLEQESIMLRHELQCERHYAEKLEGALAGLVRNTHWREQISKDMHREYNCNTSSNELTEQGRTTIKEPV